MQTPLEVKKPDLQVRIIKALSVLARVESLPDTGTHGDACTHRDCIAYRVRKILRGEP